MEHIGTLTGHISTLWQAALLAEGFGKVSTLDRNAIPDITAELDSIKEYQLLVSFIDKTQWDLKNRERALIEYVSPIISKSTLEKTIIPRGSAINKILSNITMLYKQAPQRWIEDEKQDEIYNALISSSRINTKGKDWYRRFKLCGTIAVRPVVANRAGKARMSYDIYQPNEFRVMLDDSGEVVKFMHQCEEFHDGFRGYSIIVWTKDEVYSLGMHAEKEPIGGNEDTTNPYGIIPFSLFLAGNLYDGGLWELHESNLYMNFLQLLLTDDISFAAFGVWLAKNLPMISTGSILSPRVMLSADQIMQGDGSLESPTLENISGNPQADLIMNIRERVMKNAAINEGISPAMMENQVREMSGKALAQMKAEINDQRQNDAEIMQDCEKDLYYRTAVVANYHRAYETSVPKLDMSADLVADPDALNIDFPDDVYDDLDAVKQYELDKLKIGDGLLSPVDLYMKYNTDLTDIDEIKARIIQNIKEGKELQGVGIKTSFLSGIINSQPAITPVDTILNAGNQ